MSYERMKQYSSARHGETIEEKRREYINWKPWTNPIDVEVVREIGRCECGGKLAFQGWQNPQGTKRIAVMYCITCQQAEEF
jgi:hypothetical protein